MKVSCQRLSISLPVGGGGSLFISFTKILENLAGRWWNNAFLVSFSFKSISEGKIKGVSDLIDNKLDRIRERKLRILLFP